MLGKAYPYLLFVCLLLISSCTGNKKQIIESKPAVFLAEALEQNLEKALFHPKDTFIFQDSLQKFYAERNFDPLWQEHIQNDSLRAILFSFVNNTILEEGLFLEPFQLEAIKSWLPDTPYVFSDEYYQKMAKAEIVVSSTLLYLHQFQKVGMIQPKELFSSFYDLPVKKFEDFDLYSVLNPKSYQKTILSEKIKDSTYLDYKLILDSLYPLVSNDSNLLPIDVSGITKIEVGDTTNLLPLIAHNLLAMKIISKKEAAKAHDSIYNKAFLPYIRRAQSSFGLHDDGIIGMRTLKLFNFSVVRKIEEVKLNMERERWIERPEEPPFVLVNLPQYKMFLHYVDSMKTMDVCIGKPRPASFAAKMKKYDSTGRYWDRPRDFETPQIHSKIEYFVLNPTWIVPRSIVVREMYHQMRRDTGYLRRNHYEVYYKGELQNPDTINWKKYSATKIPFRFVQTWGDHNALGKVKYIFRNRHHIYFHDTPQKSKFKYTQRSVSHGCVRLSDPMQFGEFVLKDHPDVNYDDFRIYLGLEPLDEERLEEYDPADTTAEIQPLEGTKIVHLDKTIPVYFLYRTVWFNEEGKAQFRSDVYGKNEQILSAVKKKKANLPSFN